MKSRSFIAFAIALISIMLLNNCGKDETETGLIEFTFSNNSISNARITEEEAVAIVISIETATGESLYENQELSISAFGIGYVSEPFVLEIGDHVITKFLVKNESGQVIYATPIEGSVLAGLIDNPLPISFQVLSDQITKVELEVIETASRDPEDLGYSNFIFSIVPTKEILVSVLNQLENGDYEFVESTVTAFHDGDSSFTQALGDSINVVTLRGDVSEIMLKFSSIYESFKYSTLTSDSLDHHRTIPLTIVFSDTARVVEDLVAYYPFNGSTNDASGNGLDGTASGAVLTTDRHDNANNAYEFTGNNDVITVAHNDLLNITDSLTLSAWINLYSGNQWGSRIIDKVQRGTTVGYLMDIWNPDNTSSTFITSVRFIGREGFTHISEDEVSLNEWNHVAVTYYMGLVKIYLNGELVKVNTEAESQLLTNTEILEIGNDKNGAGQDLYDPFRGKIDEVRIYNRTLSQGDIRGLMEF